MASMNYVVCQLEKMGLTVAVEGGFVLAEDPGLDFERSHDGVRGISKWFVEVKEEYEMAINDLLAEGKDEPVTDTQIEEALPKAESYSEDTPCHTQAGDHGEEIKPHTWEPQLGCPKEVYQAGLVDDQDRGGTPSPEGYAQKLAAEVVHSVKTEFEVSGIGYVTGEFKRRFTEKDAAQDFARACVAVAKSPKYASTIRVMTVGL